MSPLSWQPVSRLQGMRVWLREDWHDWRYVATHRRQRHWLAAQCALAALATVEHYLSPDWRRQPGIAASLGEEDRLLTYVIFRLSLFLHELRAKIGS